MSTTDGDCPDVLLCGSYGIGKTSLLRDTAAAAMADGAVVLFGTCLDVGDSWPLHPLRNALEQFQAADGSVASRVVDLAEKLAGGTDSGSQVENLGEIRDDLLGLCPDERLVLVLDDLHHGDLATVRLVRVLVSAPQPRRVSVLGALRTDAGRQSQADMITFDFHRAGADVVELQPLDHQATLRVARSASGAGISNAGQRSVLERSGGVPRYIEALAGQSPDDRGPPPSVTAAVNVRLEALGRTARSLVRAVSLGRESLDHEVARVVLDLDDREICAAADEAVASGILSATTDSYHISPVVCREVVESGILPPERTVLHRKIAAVMEQVGRVDGLDAVHWATHMLEAGDGERALSALVAAGRDGGGVGVGSNGWRCWTVVVEIIARAEGPDDHLDLLVEAADAALVAEEFESALELLDRALDADPALPPRLGDLDRLYLDRARCLRGLGRLREAEEICSELFNRAKIASDVALDAGALSAELLSRLDRYEEAIGRAEATIDRSSSGPPNDLAALRARAALAYSHAYLGGAEKARTSLRDEMERASETDEPELIEAASWHYVDLLMGPLNELEAGVEVARAQTELLLGRGVEPRFTTRLLAAATTGLFRLGRWPEAQAAATDGLHGGPNGVARVDLLLSRARALMGLGEFDEAEADLDQATMLVGREPIQRHDLPLTTLRAGLALWRNRVEIARDEVGAALARRHRWSTDEPWLLAPLLWHGLRAEAMAASARQPVETTEAEGLLGAMIRLEETASAEEDQAEHLRGYLYLCRGEYDRARLKPEPGVWREAADVWDRCGHPYPAAYSRLRHADVLLSNKNSHRSPNGAGDRDAKEVLSEGLAIARRLQAKPLIEEILELAVRANLKLDVDVAPDAGDDDDDLSKPELFPELTVRERQVLAEMAKGITNAEIGKALFISARTAGTHLSSVYDKLDVDGRVEARAVFEQRVRSAEQD